MADGACSGCGMSTMADPCELCCSEARVSFLETERDDLKAKVVKLVSRISDLEKAADVREHEIMGCVLGIIDMARASIPPRGTSAKRALRIYADMSEKTARALLPGWDKFVAYVRRETSTEGKEIH